MKKKLRNEWLDRRAVKYSLKELFFIRARAFLAWCYLGDSLIDRKDNVAFYAEAVTLEYLVCWFLTAPWWTFSDYAIREKVGDLFDRYADSKLCNVRWVRIKEPPYWD
ncbi:MAG: hypothetical protein FWG50_07185 [Kiritimatiellaeota bacterium]|nr:hypothetical protein [Kiritimatiellota bacterium]